MITANNYNYTPQDGNQVRHVTPNWPLANGEVEISIGLLGKLFSVIMQREKTGETTYKNFHYNTTIPYYSSHNNRGSFSINFISAQNSQQHTHK